MIKQCITLEDGQRIDTTNDGRRHGTYIAPIAAQHWEMLGECQEVMSKTENWLKYGIGITGYEHRQALLNLYERLKEYRSNAH